MGPDLAARRVTTRSLRGGIGQHPFGDTMTPQQIEHARHALGFQGGRNKRSYRNRYVIAPGCEVHARWMDMVKNGWAERYPAKKGQTYDLFCLTLAGAQLALKKGESLCPEDFPLVAA